MADAVTKAARLVLGGKPPAAGGLFSEPTILTGADASMKLAVAETFGPVAALFRFDTGAEAVAAANATEFGLAAYFCARDPARVWRVAEALECGMVDVNKGVISAEAAPFGGIKQSGQGREGSRHGAEDYLEIKYLCLGGLSEPAPA